MPDNIYISSVAFSGCSVEDMIATAVENDFNIEFSSGMSYRSDMESIYLNAPLKKLAHNYFPAPLEPFVINLASSNPVIRERSVEHCINGLRISKESGSPFFAAHAGFCIDPGASELGQPLTIDRNFDKALHWSIFLESVNRILSEAEILQTDFLIENNVIAPFNYHHKTNPLLCCESNDITDLFNAISHPRLGLLLDTAHLKVSCITLGLDMEQELEKIKPYISALHHSDNDGHADTNAPLDDTYWFLPHIKAYNNKVQVIEVKKLTTEEMHKHIKLLQYAAN